MDVSHLKWPRRILVKPHTILMMSLIKETRVPKPASNNFNFYEEAVKSGYIRPRSEDTVDGPGFYIDEWEEAVGTIPPKLCKKCIVCFRNVCICSISDLTPVWIGDFSEISDFDKNTPMSLVTQLILKHGNIFRFRNKLNISLIHSKKNIYICLDPHDSLESIAYITENKIPYNQLFKIQRSGGLNDQQIANAIASKPVINGAIFYCDLDQIDSHDIFYYHFRSLKKYTRKMIKKMKQIYPRIDVIHELTNKEKNINRGILLEAPKKAIEFVYTQRKNFIIPGMYRSISSEFKDLTSEQALRLLFSFEDIKDNEKGALSRYSSSLIPVRWTVNNIRDSSIEPKELWEERLQKHYQRNKHHPENPDFGDIQSTIECLCDLLVSALRISITPRDAIATFIPWIVDLGLNEYKVPTKFEIRPKFSKLHPIGILIFMTRLHSRGFHPKPIKFVAKDGQARKDILSHQGARIQDSLHSILSVPQSQRREIVDQIPEWRVNLSDTRNHIKLVNTLLSEFRLPQNHDNDKMNFDNLVVYMWKWCIEGKEKPKQYCSDIPDFPKTSTLPVLLADKFSGFKSGFSKYIKDDILDGVVAQANRVLQYILEILGPVHTLMKKFKESILPLLKMFNLDKAFGEVDANDILKLLMIWISFTTSSSLIIKGACIWLASTVLGITEPLKLACSTVASLMGSRLIDDGDVEYCSSITSSYLKLLGKFFTPDKAKYAGYAVAFIVALFLGVKAFDPDFVKTQGGAVMGVFKNMHFVGAGLLGISKVATWVASIVEVAIRWIMKNVLNQEPSDEKAKKEARAFQEEVMKWAPLVRAMETESSYRLANTQKIFRTQVADMWKEGLRFKVILLDDAKLDSREQKIPQAIRIEVEHCLRILQKLNNHCVRIESFGRTRPTPFHIQFVGDPGVGKSSLRDKIAGEIKTRFYPDVDLNNMCYCDPGPAVDFKDGYRGQPIYYIDDMWKTLDAKEIVEFLTWVSNNPIVLPMARLEEKETYFTSEWLISSTNTPYPMVNDVACHQAVYRRRHVLAKVKCDPDVLDPSTKSFSANLFKRKYPEHESKDYPHLKFDLMDPLKNGPEAQQQFEKEATLNGYKLPMVDLTYDEFIERVLLRRTHLLGKESERYKDKNNIKKELVDSIKVIQSAYNKLSRDKEVHLYNYNFSSIPPDALKDQIHDASVLRIDVEDYVFDFDKIISAYPDPVNSVPEIVYKHFLEVVDGKIPVEIVNIQIKQMLNTFVSYSRPSDPYAFGFAITNLENVISFMERRVEIAQCYCKMYELYNTPEKIKFEDFMAYVDGKLGVPYELYHSCGEIFEESSKKMKTTKDARFQYYLFNLLHCCEYVDRVCVKHGLEPKIGINELSQIRTDFPQYCSVKWNFVKLEFTTDVNECLDRLYRTFHMTSEEKEDRNNALNDLMKQLLETLTMDQTEDFAKGLISYYDMLCKDPATDKTAIVWVLDKVAEQLEERGRDILDFKYNRRRANLSHPDPYNDRWSNTNQFYKTRAAGKKTSEKEGNYLEYFMLIRGDDVFGTIKANITSRISNAPGYVITPGMRAKHLRKYDHDQFKKFVIDSMSIRLTEKEAKKNNWHDLSGLEFKVGFLISLTRVIHEGEMHWVYKAETEKIIADRTGVTVKRCLPYYHILLEQVEMFASLPSDVQMWFFNTGWFYNKVCKDYETFYDNAKHYYHFVKRTVIDKVRGTLTWFWNHFSHWKKTYMTVLTLLIIVGSISSILGFFQPAKEYVSKSIFPTKKGKETPQYCGLDESNLKLMAKLVRTCQINEQSCSLFLISGSYILLPYHVLYPFMISGSEKNFELKYRPTYNLKTLWTTIIEPHDCYYIEGSDSVLVRVKAFPPSSDNTKYLFKKGVLDVVFEIPESVTAVCRDRGDPFGDGINTNTVMNVKSISRKAAPELGTQFDKLVECSGNWIPGQSGAPVVAAVTGKDASMIIGFVSHNIGNYCYASSVYQEDVLEGIAHFEKFIPLPTFTKLPEYCNTEITPNFAKYVESHIEVVGTIEPSKIIGGPHKTQYVKTKIASELSTLRRPAILNPNSSYVPEGSHPLQHSINKHGRDVIKEPTPEARAKVRQGIFQYLFEIIKYKKLRVLTTDEAIAGIPGPGTESINTKTSPGAPWIWERDAPGKKAWIQYDDLTMKWTVSPVVYEEVEKMMWKLREGKLPETPMYDFAKDELRPHEKVIGPPVKTRSITVDNFIVTLCYRRLFLDLERLLHLAADGSTQYLPGIDINGLPAYQLYKRMFGKNKCAVDLDVGNWDGHYPHWLFEDVTAIINRLYGDDRLTGWDNTARRTLASHICFAIVIFGDMFYRKWRGMTSGFGGTTLYNTVGHMDIAYLFWCEIVEEKGYLHLCNLRSYLKEVETAIYSDDLLQSFDEITSLYFNGKVLAEKYEKYGWPVTIASKTGTLELYKDPSEVTILKRHFKKLGNTTYPFDIVAALDIEVIKDLRYWIRRQPNMKEQFNQNLYVFLEGLMRHGKEVYDELVEETNVLLRENRLPCITYTWEEMLLIDRNRILCSKNSSAERSNQYPLSPSEQAEKLRLLQQEIDWIDNRYREYGTRKK